MALADRQIIIKPAEYPGALPNPLKGFRGGDVCGNSTLQKQYIRWNEVENDASDGPERLIEYGQKTWAGLEQKNVKIIPRIFLEWPGGRWKGRYWPADLKEGDYSSETFHRRLVGMIEKMGQAWDQDPRIAFVEMGLIGYWGEHHHPSPTPAQQKLMGDAFVAAFKHKLVMRRHPWEFTHYPFGVYWDSFAHPGQIRRHGLAIQAMGDFWKVRPLGGECAYNWGQPLGRDPLDTVTNHGQEVLRWIRRLHANHLGLIGRGNDDPRLIANAQRIQKALGYRFVIDEFRCDAQLAPGEILSVDFVVRNTGSSPLHYNWPVEISLLETTERAPVWKALFEDVDIRRWVGGELWDQKAQAYVIPAPSYRVRGRFPLPGDLPKGRYIVALAILDPAGMLPSARFAIGNYFRGGRHPMGIVGLGVEVDQPELDPAEFDDPQKDVSLRYEA